VKETASRAAQETKRAAIGESDIRGSGSSGGTAGMP